MKTLTLASLALTVALAVPAHAQPVNVATAVCIAEAEQWADSVWHMHTRLKVPLWSFVGFLVGGPGTAAWMGVLAANVDSPRERQMLWSYENWCLGGKVGPMPDVPRAFLELF